MIKKVVGIYYSPIGGTAIMTERLVTQIASLIDECSTEEVTTEYCDLYRMEKAGDTSGCSFDEDTVAVIAMPCYIGKIPMPGVKLLQQFAGSKAMTVTAVSYGGRSYGNSLYELRELAEKCGFTVVGAGAFGISYRAARGSSRSSAPMMDTGELSKFGKAAAAKISRLGGCEVEGLRIKPAPLEVSGRMPVHKISRLSPRAAAIAEGVLARISLMRRNSEWFL